MKYKNRGVKMSNHNEKVKENYLRRQAKRQGFILKKSRARKPNIDNRGGYMIVNAQSNYIEVGEKFDLTIDEVAKFLDEGEEKLKLQ